MTGAPVAGSSPTSSAGDPVNGYGGVTTAALAIAPGPADRITFVAQRLGPLAGNWVLPGGRVELGETLPDAARREMYEETGGRIGALRLTGVYEMHGTWRHGPYHIITFVFRAEEPVALPHPATGDRGVDSVVQISPGEIRLPPTVRLILHDAEIYEGDRAEIKRDMAQLGISMRRLRNGAVEPLTGSAWVART